VRGGNVIGQALGEELAAQAGQILAPGDIFGDGIQPVPGRRFHQLEILLVLRGGTGRHLVDKFAGMAWVGPTELGEGAKEISPSDGTKPRIEKESTSSS
jgi:hypothetical protein